jgi:Natural resistance-associated macrophage protein
MDWPSRPADTRVSSPFAAVVGRGVLAGLSDDDPAGITTYSILGADFGSRLLWVLLLSTVALVVFHELGARMGCVTGRGLAGLIRDRYGRRAAVSAAAVLLVANVGTTCAEFAGVAAASELAGVSRYASVPAAAILVSTLVVRGGFKRVEHVLLLLGDGLRHLLRLRNPRPSALARGDRRARRSRAAAPASRASRCDCDRGHDPRTLGPGVHPVIRGRQAAGPERPRTPARGRDRRRRDDACCSNPPAFDRLFGQRGAWPQGTSRGLRSGGTDFYGTYALVVGTGALVVLVPGAPLVPILFITQAINAVLLLPLLGFIALLTRNRSLMGEYATGRAWTVVVVATALMIAAATVVLGLVLVAG